MAEFDVVVIGAGTAGATLAGVLARTSELEVCLLEAGPDYGPYAPGAWPDDLNDVRRRSWSHDWGYMRADSGGPAVLEPRARVVGGCSTHNQAAALWGLPSDYDAWAAAGNEGWSYSELAPLINRIESAQGGTTRWRGRDGPVPTRPFADADLAFWQKAFLETAVGAGYARLEDLSAPEPSEGVMPFHANVKGTTRWNSAFAFLDPARSLPNLTIRPGVLVDRFEFTGDSATRLVCRKGAVEERVTARTFVLAAGTFGSPAALVRSGIGPADELRRLGIVRRLALAGVGANLHDHPGIGVRCELGPSAVEAYQRDLTGDRLYPSQVIMRARSRNCAGPFDLHLLPSQSPLEGGGWSFDLIGFHMRSYSRGTVRLVGTDPGRAPKVDFQFMTGSGEADVPVLCEAVLLLRRLVSTEPLRSAIAREVQPGPAVRDEKAIAAYVRSAARTYSHCVGTCKMGPSSDPAAVVDCTGRVHGMSNLYVADASVMPEIPLANTNLTCFLIGYKMAETLCALNR